MGRVGRDGKRRAKGRRGFEQKDEDGTKAEEKLGQLGQTKKPQPHPLNDFTLLPSHFANIHRFASHSHPALTVIFFCCLLFNYYYFF